MSKKNRMVAVRFRLICLMCAMSFIVMFCSLNVSGAALDVSLLQSSVDDLVGDAIDMGEGAFALSYADVVTLPQVQDLLSVRRESLRSLPSLVFNDVPASKWYSAGVVMGVYTGLLSGYPDKTFRGDSAISRAEFATVLARHNTNDLEISNGTKVNNYAFSQQQLGNSWYTPYWHSVQDYMLPLRGGLDKDIIQGPITRGEVIFAVAKLYFSLEIQGNGGFGAYVMQLSRRNSFKSPFTDIPLVRFDITREYTSYMRAVSDASKGVPADVYAALLCLGDKGIVVGDTEKRSNWALSITRAEVVTIIEKVVSWDGTRGMLGLGGFSYSRPL